VVFLFFLTFLLSTVFAQTQDCDNLSGMYFCIDSDTIKQRINWCWCNSLDNPDRWILYPDTFVLGGYIASLYHFSPKGLYSDLSWPNAVRSNICSQTTFFPVYVDTVVYYVFVVSYDYKTKKNQIVHVATNMTNDINCLYPSMSPKIVIDPGAFVCPGGPNLDRDIKYIQMAKFGQNECSLCKCIEPPPIRQCNLPCSGENYDKRKGSFCSLGCALSSLVSVMQYLGCNVDPCDVNRCNECFDNRGNVIWSNIIQKYCLNKLSTKVEKLSCPRSKEEWKKYCNSDKYVITNVNTEGQEGSRRRTEGNRNIRIRSSQHFVVFKCIKEDGTLETMDPAYSGKYKLSDCRDIRVIYKK